jgi:hypothetical protein
MVRRALSSCAPNNIDSNPESLPQRDYTERGQSNVWRLPNINPPPPHRPVSVYPSPPPLVRGENALAGWIGGGGSDTALYSTHVSTLWSLPYQLSHQVGQLYRVAD